MEHTHALNPSSARTGHTIALIGAELIAYRVNRKPEQRAQLISLAEIADSLGALSASDKALLAASLEVRHV